LVHSKFNKKASSISTFSARAEALGCLVLANRLRLKTEDAMVSLSKDEKLLSYWRYWKASAERPL
jgi:hypothetical protein